MSNDKISTTRESVATNGSNFHIINEGKVSIRKNDTTFYNPAQKTNRDISILVISEYFKNKENIRILDAMSATGLRGLRYLKEIKNLNLFFNDINDNAIDTIFENLKYNNVSSSQIKYFEKNLCEIRETFSHINVVKSDCNVLMCTLQNFFDVIDIDPFGSCSEYIENAIRAIKHNGLICFTSTDKGVLITNENKSIVKYETTILKKYSAKEMALRSLLSCISRHAAKFGVSIEPLLSLSLDFYLRVFVRILKKGEKRVIADNGLFYLCNCGNFKSADGNRQVVNCNINYKLFSLEDPDFMKKLKNACETINFSNGNICEVCNKKMKICGPFWNKHLHDQNLVSKIKSNLSSDDNRLVGIFNFVGQEISTMWYYEIPLLSKNLKMPCIRLIKMLTALKNLGFDVSLTHCDIKGFKTNALVKIIYIVLQIGNLEPDFKLFSKNDIVNKIFEQKYYKGLIDSKLGPLSLPRKD